MFAQQVWTHDGFMPQPHGKSIEQIIQLALVARVRGQQLLLSIGKRFHEILNRPIHSSQSRSMKDLAALSASHPTSAYARLAKGMLRDKESAERFPNEWIAILLGCAESGPTKHHEERNTFSDWGKSIAEFRSIFGSDADFKARADKLQRFFSKHKR